MIQLSQTESALVEELVNCLASAMQQTPGVDPRYANKTKLQKLTFLAIDEFELPITYSWYLAGSVVPDDSIAPPTLRSAFDEVPSVEEPSIDNVADDVEGSTSTDPSPESTKSKREIPPTVNPVLFNDFVTEPHQPRSSSDLSDHGPYRDDIIDFYTRVVPDIWHQNTMRFLQNFYRKHAPPEFRSLYLSSVHLRTHLSDLERAVAARASDNEPRQPISDLVRAVELEISDLHYELRENEKLTSTFESVVHGTDIIEDALMMLDQQPNTAFTEAQIEAVAMLQDFFYYHVWRYPCLIISRETATGPQADVLREAQTQQLESFTVNFDDRCRDVRSELAAANLLPCADDYIIKDDAIGEQLSNLSEEYLSR